MSARKVSEIPLSTLRRAAEIVQQSFSAAGMEPPSIEECIRFGICGAVFNSAVNDAMQEPSPGAAAQAHHDIIPGLPR